MNRHSSGWTPPEEIDRLAASVSIEQVIGHYGQSLPDNEGRKNIRMPCPIESCHSQERGSNYGQLSIERTPPYRIQCFSCGLRGKIFDLMWVLKHRQPPTGGKVRGNEFQEMLAELRQIAHGEHDSTHKPDFVEPTDGPAVAPKEVNVPLARSENERTRALVDLWALGETDPAAMSPAASKYFRQRPWLTPELCAKWGVSYLPRNAKSTMRGRVVYRIDSVKGEALAYAGRDPDYDDKRHKWQQSGRGKQPVKTMFPSAEYFHKGLEFYGQQVSRLDEPGYGESIRQTGLWIVEGFNDVLRLDALGQPALGAMFNRLTELQIEKLVQFANQTGAPGITFLFDRNKQGQEGQDQAMLAVSKRMPVLNGWGRLNAAVEEPEQIDQKIYTAIQQSVRERW